ncbi:MAG TPA: hypothetical protein VE262_06625 [Blastocatellia bacterium]|nr:hypothetical protein [Blastocatellia bacterium]
MNDRKDDSTGDILKLIVLAGAAYLIYELVMLIIAVLSFLFFGLAWILFFTTLILVAFFLLRYIRDKQYGDGKRMRELIKLEEQRIRAVSQAPDHMKSSIETWFHQRQEALWESRAESRFDLFADRTKQVLGIFRRGK